MPHPERDAEALIGMGQGRAIFESLVRSFARAAA
jgi:phosphoribosylformylglycinamidine (FGAM) synthase-like amidotransferase family enzyme